MAGESDPSMSGKMMEDVKDENTEQEPEAIGTLKGVSEEVSDDEAIVTAPDPYEPIPVRSRRRPIAPLSNSESDSSSSSYDSDDDTNVRNASRLTGVGLFKAYARKLGHKPGPEIDMRLRTRGRKGPQLVAGLVDYVHSLETRIGSLESRLNEDKPKDDSNKPKDDSNKSKEPATPASSKLSIKFFHFDQEVIPATRRYNPERDFMPNTYRSTVAPRHFIRVLYRWKDEKHTEITQTDGHDEAPNPEDIEVVGLRIDSFPIASFFSKINSSLPFSIVVELFKPFRSIIRNLGEFRAHLAKLESDWGSSTVNESDSYMEDLQSKDHVNVDEEVIAPPGSNTDTNQPSKSIKIIDPRSSNKQLPGESHRALLHFRELMKLIDQYLEPQIKLYEQVREGSIKKIAFENLWMLFNFNDTIYCPSKRGQEVTIIEPVNKSTMYSFKPKFTPQAYRVIHSTGGIGIYDNGNLDHDSIVKFEEQGQETSPVNYKVRFSQLTVFCFSVAFDGEKYTPAGDYFVFKPFEGEVDITSLEGYPIRFHPQEKKISKMLLDRGRKFMDMTAISHMSYEGLTVGDDRQEVASSVVIDVKLFYQENESARPFSGPLKTTAPPRPFGQVIEVAASFPDCPHNKPCRRTLCIRDTYTEVSNVHKANASLRRYMYEYDPGEKSPKLARDAVKRHMEATNFVLLLPGQIPGFALRSRKWVQLDANLLQWTLHHDRDGKQSADDAGWKDLVLPPGHKDIVLAMVKNHTASTGVLKEGVPQAPEVDLVKGKGKGCIILIHGAPGVGKTSTAECVAAYTKRPLFPITCGDIGYQPDVVEKNLDRLFYLAHRWGCVLLLDEADVFLAKRSKEDIKRNGLVSIFLRTLEYYSGILFLTTNRVGMIDDAFRSRLHLTLYYPKLDRAQSRKIWKVNLRRLKQLNAERVNQGQPKLKIDREKILRYADLNYEELHWNGRQIRNAFQSALALADFKAQELGEGAEKAPTLSVEQFQTIAQASHEFDHYLQVTHGLDEDKVAARDRTRGAYKRTEARKLRTLPVSDDESESESESESGEAGEVLSQHDDDDDDDDDNDGSDSDNKKLSIAHKKQKEKEKKKSKQQKSKKTTRSKKHSKKEDAKSERKKGKEKAKDTDESDDSSDGDE